MTTGHSSGAPTRTRRSSCGRPPSTVTATATTLRRPGQPPFPLSHILPRAARQGQDCRPLCIAHVLVLHRCIRHAIGSWPVVPASGWQGQTSTNAHGHHRPSFPGLCCSWRRWDASQIYGTSEEVATSLREGGDKCEMRLDANGLMPLGADGLPESGTMVSLHSTLPCLVP